MILKRIINYSKVFSLHEYMTIWKSPISLKCYRMKGRLLFGERLISAYIAQWLRRLTPSQEVRRSIHGNSYAVTFMFCWFRYPYKVNFFWIYLVYLCCKYSSLLWLFQYHGDIEEHLGVTIDQVGTDLKIPINEFDGKVTYGSKQRGSGKNHLSLWTGSVNIFFWP